MKRDLNHPKVKPFSREVASAYKLDRSFVDFIFAAKRPASFRYWVEDAAGGWTCYLPDEYEVAYPLWCTNANQTLMLTNESGVTFGKGFHDEPELIVIARTTQGLLTDLMITMYETELSEDELKQAAAACGYRFLEDLVPFVQRSGSSADYERRLSRFIAKIDAKSR